MAEDRENDSRDALCNLLTAVTKAGNASYTERMRAALALALLEDKVSVAEADRIRNIINGTSPSQR